jgi:hypothetical protein
MDEVSGKDVLDEMTEDCCCVDEIIIDEISVLMKLQLIRCLRHNDRTQDVSINETTVDQIPVDEKPVVCR